MRRPAMDALIDALARGVGRDRARALADAAARDLGYDPESLGADEALDVLARLAGRGDLVAGVGASTRARAPSPADVEPHSRIERARTFTTAGLAELLAPTVGREKAMDTILRAAVTLGLPDTGLSRANALDIMEHAAQVPGIVGVAARFAKVKLVLK